METFLYCDGDGDDFKTMMELVVMGIEVEMEMVLPLAMSVLMPRWQAVVLDQCLQWDTARVCLAKPLSEHFPRRLSWALHGSVARNHGNATVFWKKASDLYRIMLGF